MPTAKGSTTEVFFAPVRLTQSAASRGKKYISISLFHGCGEELTFKAEDVTVSYLPFLGRSENIITAEALSLIP